MVTLPLFNEGQWIGNINLGRFEVRPFDQKQASILQAFADQAAIAVANAKLFNDLDAALERQTAMTDVLDAVSTSRLDLQPVFDTVVHHANRLCSGTGATIMVRDGDELQAVAQSGRAHTEEALERLLALRLRIDADSTAGHAALTAEIQHVTDVDTDGARYRNLPMRNTGAKSGLVVPIVRNGDVLGVLAFARQEVGGYSDAEISLLSAFADQAAIAIDNARLLQEIEERNADLSESLELQTATSDVLRLISAHPGDLQTVLEGIMRKAAALCDADGGLAVLVDGDELRIAASADEHTQRRGRAQLSADLGRRQSWTGAPETKQRRSSWTTSRRSHRRRSASQTPRGAQLGRRRPHARGRMARHHPPPARRGPTLRREPDQGAAGVRRPGGDRGRERASFSTTSMQRSNARRR